MIELYLLEQTLRAERTVLDRQANREAARQATRRERHTSQAVPRLRALRRRLALALLALADWLDPRPAFGSAHRPGQPALNGSAHHA